MPNPWTGKSTTILGIIIQRSPMDSCSLVTCVQNKAVDSMAEKLAMAAQDIAFFVLGHKSNLGIAR